VNGGPSLIPQKMQEYIQSQIEADEQVLWAGNTDVGGRTRRLWPVVMASVFMMFLCSFVFWSNPDRWLLVLFSLVVWAGIPAFVYWRQTAHLRSTVYAVTDKRALILSLGKPGRTESYPPEKIEFVQRVAKKSGRGDVYFIELRGRGTDVQSFKHGFLDINDSSRVAQLLSDMQARGSRSGESSARVS
jgi:hypothetical protein